MRNLILYLVPCCLILLCACRSPDSQPTTDADPSAIADDIQNVFDEWNEQWTLLDVDGIMTHFARGDEIVWVLDGSVVHGPDAIEASIRGALEEIEKWNYVNYGEAHIDVLGPHAAVHTVGYDESFVLKSGDTVQIRGGWTNVFKRIDGQWKVVHSAVSHASDAV